jgi:hypothetical protein
MKKTTAYLFFLLVLTATNVSSQTGCKCCDDGHRQFDFWIGDWIVKDTLGTVVGENRITKIEDGCVLKEQWTGTSGTTGTSMNYFDKSNKTWNQLWLDNGGNQLKLKGQLALGKMILRSEMEQTTDSNYYNQITWSKNEDGTITQLWEIFDASNQPLRTLFKGIYHRKK